MCKRRILPDPRKKPAAFENVGAAVTAVAANAPSTPRRVNDTDLGSSVTTTPKVHFYPRLQGTRRLSSFASNNCRRYATLMHFAQAFVKFGIIKLDISA